MSRVVPRLAAPLALAALILTLPACDSEPTGDGPFAEAEANPGEWVFVDVEGAQCRDGSATGLGVRLQEDSDNLMIYLEGGGACFNAATCASNPASFNEASFISFVGLSGDEAIFSTDAANPVGDWNMIYVPYCTGDIHGGSRTDVAVEGVAGTQQFVGHQNLELYLDLLAPYFGDPDQVLLAGRSAGGFGALLNFATVADAFDGSDLTLLDDSGPVFYADDVFSPQIGAAFAGTWNLPAALPSDAAALFATDGLQGIYDYYDDRYPGATFGLSSSLQDQTIRYFFGFGQPDGSVSGDEYAAGLRDLRSKLPSSWATYYADGAAHTFIGTSTRYFGTSAGVELADWLDDLLDGQATDVDPGIATRVASR